jgi:catechol 2,3-dioxygenase-like lactoylglutathione lyase family enzyme
METRLDGGGDLVRAVHHTGYTVDDLERSLAFYRDLLGMEVVAAQEKRRGYLAAIVGYPDAHVRMAHLRVPGGEHVLELFEYREPAGRSARPLPPSDTGTPHLCFTVTDLDALYDRLREHQVDTFFSPPVDIDTGVNRGGRSLYLRDPDGIPVELFQPPPGHPLHSSGGEVAKARGG